MGSYVAASVALVLFAGLLNWIITQILVAGGLFHEYREWVGRHGKRIALRRPILGNKLAYFVSCPLCVGTWIGFAQGVVMPGPLQLIGWMSWFNWAANGLVYKAVGHLFFQLNGWFHSRIELMNSETKATQIVSESESDQVRPKVPATS